MADKNVYDIVRIKMKELGLPKMDIEPVIFNIAASGQETVFANGDYFMLAAFFSDNPVSGKIVSTTKALMLNSLTATSQYYKHRFFTGAIQMINFDTDEDLNIEFLRVTPILDNN